MLPLLSCLAVMSMIGWINVYAMASSLFILVPISLAMWSGEVYYDCFGESIWSVSLVLLTLWVGGLALLVSLLPTSQPELYGKANLCLITVLSLAFSALDGVCFFVLFEGSLIPISFLILMWGYYIERVEAIYYMVVYTILGGGLHMLALVIMYKILGSTSFLIRVTFSTSNSSVLLAGWWVGLIAPFMIKAPCYGFHLWLPKAHVEAPTSGSMILAGVLLKLGVYGMVMYLGVYSPPMGWVLVFQSLGIWGSWISALVALRQVDIKSVIAYSSVSHMSLLISSVFTGSTTAIQGCLFLSISHGLSSSGLFAWAGIVYEKTGTRCIMSLSGLRAVSPQLSSGLIILIMMASGIPPFLGFLGEVFLVGPVFLSWPLGGAMIATSGVLLLASFLYLFLATQHSGMSALLMNAEATVEREFLVLMGHVVPSFMLFLQPGVLSVF